MNHPHQVTLPEQYSPDTLEKNLDALTRVNGNLVQRICLPVDGSHVHFPQDGKIYYQLYNSLFHFSISQTDFAGTVNNVNGSSHILLFGIGLGELLDYLIDHFPKARISVWDRDPWLVRLALMKEDYSLHLLSGRLHLGMCSDLLDLIDLAKDIKVICHPLLGSVYENEYKLLTTGLKEKRAIVCTGDLFVDDVTRALRGYGYSPYLLDMQRLSIEEIDTSITRFDPQVVFTINYMNGLVELCDRHRIELLCWQVDPAIDWIKPCNAPADRAHVFVYRKANIPEFERAGFKNIEYLPLASDTEKRSPLELKSNEKETYGGPLSFVGSSLLGQAKSFRNIFLSDYKSFHLNDPQAMEEGGLILEEILSIQRKDFSTYVVPDLLLQYFSDFIDFQSQLPDAYDPFMLVGEIAAAEKRINYIARLGHLDLKVWGDDSWRVSEQYGVKYMGGAGHTHEVNKIYSASLINIDINRIYQMDIVPMRIFDIMACGGFVLAEYNHELNEFFETGKEVETYRTFDELVAKIDYFMDHSDEASAIANRGQEVVRNHHTVRMRVDHMINALGNTK